MPARYPEFDGIRATVMGLGRFGGGIGAAKFLAANGARVTVTDMKTADDLADSVRALDGLDIRFALGAHDPADFTGADLVVVNPAVPRESEYVAIARNAGARLATEIGLFAERCPAPVCGITGSNGKSTTVSLLAAMAVAAGRPHCLGGNIGVSLLAELDSLTPEHLVILELSSFQLEWLGEMGWSPHIAAVLNILPNHLDRHGTLENYAAAKAGILEHQSAGDSAVIVHDDPGARAMERLVRGRLVRAGSGFSGDGVTSGGSDIVEIRGGARTVIGSLDHLQVPGAHNRVNALAAAACAREADIWPAGIDGGIASFRGLPHRLELVGECRGVRFFNDSKATTPDAAAAGITAFDGNVIPILGGSDKGVSFDRMARGIAGNVHWAALIGVTAPQLAASLAAAGIGCERFASFEDAFRGCVARARAGDVVLLSPACASYDMFPDYEARGALFRELAAAHIRACGGDDRP